jgi:hypothetical protein
MKFFFFAQMESFVSFVGREGRTKIFSYNDEFLRKLVSLSSLQQTADSLSLQLSDRKLFTETIDLINFAQLGISYH